MSNPMINSTREIIPVDLAVAKTAYWRQFMQQASPTTPEEDLPKAVYISRTDLIDLAAQCEADETMLGVRAYFTLNNPFKPEDVNEVKVIMVLVKDVPGAPFGEDQLYVPADPEEKALSPNGGDEGDSNVYDFTRPCPDCCDPDSELYGEQLQRPFRRKKH